MTNPAAWEHELTNAFEALLGSPLSTFPTTSEYAVYSWADEVSADALYDLLGGDVDLGAVARNELIGTGWDGFHVDHGRSIWCIEEYAVEALGEPAGAALRAVSSLDISQRVLSGADLARVLLTHYDQLPDVDVDLLGNVRWMQRIHTDGTLFDAMRAATALTDQWARSDGGFYLGADCTIDLRWIAERPGCEPLAGWEFGEDQGALTVFAVE